MLAASGMGDLADLVKETQDAARDSFFGDTEPSFRVCRTVRDMSTFDPRTRMVWLFEECTYYSTDAAVGVERTTRRPLRQTTVSQKELALCMEQNA
jgi:hypothetical protein